MRKTGVGVTVDQIAAKRLGQEHATCRRWNSAVSRAASSLIGHPTSRCRWKAIRAKFSTPCSVRAIPRKQRNAILKSTDSLLDYVKESTASLNRKLDAADRARVSDYLDSVREIEIRVQKLEASMESMGDLPNAPLGAPEDFGELLDIQFEMMALAWQTNRTNVASMRMVKEASMRAYQNLGVSEAFHPTSHWGGLSGTRRQPETDPELSHGDFREVCRAPQGHAGWRRFDARPFDHFVRKQHGQQRRPQRRSAAAGVGRPWRRHQGEPAPALSSRTRRTRICWSRCWTAPAYLPRTSRIRRQHRPSRRFNHEDASEFADPFVPSFLRRICACYSAAAPGQQTRKPRRPT